MPTNRAADARLCINDLVPFIEAGDLRALGQAERRIEFVLMEQPNDQCRGIVLAHLMSDLNDLKVPDRPECDGFVRAIRAIIRRHQQLRIERRHAQIH